MIVGGCNIFDALSSRKFDDAINPWYITSLGALAHSAWKSNAATARQGENIP